MNRFETWHKTRTAGHRRGHRTPGFERLETRELMAVDLACPQFDFAAATAFAVTDSNQPRQAIIGGGGSETPPQFPNLPPYTQRPLSVAFKWHMKETTGPNYRYGFGPGSLAGDIPNVEEYANPRDGFDVVLDATASTTPVGTYFQSVQWTIVGEKGDRRVVGGLKPTVRLPEGRYSITLKITNSAWQSATATGQINVDNILIVSLGDSYASGEGMPHWPNYEKSIWAAGGDANATQQNNAAHRSIYSAPAQAAYLIEQMDPYTSVTFVSVAVTGASLADIYGSQIQQVEDLTTDDRGQQREIDLLFISGGGNDVRFAEIVEKLLRHDRGESLSDAARWAEQGLQSLKSSYQTLHDKVDTHLKVSDSNVFVAGYPDPSLDDSPTGTPPAIMTDVVFWEEIDATEILWAREHVLRPLERTLRSVAAAPTIGWNFVPMLNVWAGHGYSTDDPWVVTWDESMDGQGNIGGIFSPMTMGVMHPNVNGARAMAQRIFGEVSAEHALEFERGPQVTQLINRQPPRFPVPLGSPTPVYTLEVVFNAPVQVSSFAADDVRISAPDGSASRIVGVVPVGPGTESSRFTISFLPTKVGTYAISIGSGIRDRKGNWLDQNRDGIGRQIVGGDDKDVFRTQFTLASALGDKFR